MVEEVINVIIHLNMRGRPKKERKTIFCSNCGEEIKEYRNPRYTKQFCDHDCQFEYERKKRHGLL